MGSAWPRARALRRDPERAVLRADLRAIVGGITRFAADHDGAVALTHPTHRADARNLLHYLALRRLDVRSLQRRLADRGLSSLGRCEPDVLATVEAVLAAVDGRVPPGEKRFREGREALDRNTDALLGPRPGGRATRIMVTLPSEAADDYALVRRLVARGMDIARINGAHDGLDAWAQMAHNVHKASEELDRACRISVDLPGPKLRTGPLLDGPPVVRLRPARDARGVAVSPAGALLTAGPSPGGLPVDGAWLSRRRVGDTIELHDTRGSHRQLRVVGTAPCVCAVDVWDTTYLETGSELACGEDGTCIGALAPVAQAHRLRPGDALVLTRSLDPAPSWAPGQGGTAHIGCTMAEVFDAARVGHRVVLDDGRMTGVVETVGADEIRVRILAAAPKGAALRAEKGVNLPDTELSVPVIGEQDTALLELAASAADVVAVSFLHDGSDVDAVIGRLGELGASRLGVVLKIETAAAFTHLPEILLHAMRAERVGVMIARGDLAAEAGYERLAEAQEEILWLCEAAHLPVIWATEVLDRLAATGQPSRAEVTDAAMAQRAECVMLNKGPHVDTAITVLDDILRRMSGHQRKKTALLRPLRSWIGA
jgi:pyruvate kinase